MPRKPRLLTVEENFPDPSLPIGISWLQPQRPIGMHVHEFDELVIVSDGRGRHRTKAGEWTLERGDVFVVPRGEAHGYRATEALGICNVMFRPETLRVARGLLEELPGYRAFFSLEPRMRKSGGGAGRLHLNSGELEAVLALARRMRAECGEEGAPGREAVLSGMFLQMVAMVCRLYARHPHREGRRLLGLERAMERLARLEEPVPSLPELAALARMSVSSFQRAWKRYAGRAPGDYAVELRLAEACHLLADTDLTIKEIAARVGFNDSNYFSHQFRRRRGCGPRRWRGERSGAGGR